MCVLHNSAVNAFGGDVHGTAYFPTLVGDFQCAGNESTLSSCSRMTTTTNQCSNDAVGSVGCVAKGPCENDGHTMGCCTSGCAQFDQNPVSMVTGYDLDTSLPHDRHTVQCDVDKAIIVGQYD